MWIAVLVTNLGGWMQERWGGMADDGPIADSVLVAMVQAANTLPIFLMALPAGALADVLGSQ